MSNAKSTHYNRPRVYLLLVLILIKALLATESARVEIQSDGFSPKEISITQGQGVLFINKDAIPHWVASDPHPTHETYPEFDSMGLITPGNAYTFVFSKAGTWKYHDHLSSHKKGVIKVSSGLPSMFSRFDNRKKNSLEVGWENTASREEFLAFSEAGQIDFLSKKAQDSPKKTFEFLKSVYLDERSNTLAIGRAHDLAHLLGAIYSKTSGEKGITFCDPSFAFGCYHGFFENSLSGDISKISKVASFCEMVGRLGSGPWASCIHGVGHGIATFFDTEDLGMSLNICEGLNDGTSYCYDGVFMEFASTATPTFYTKDDLFSPCSNLPTRYQLSCGRNQPRIWQNIFGHTLLTAAETCTKGLDDDFIKGCTTSIGLQLGQESGGESEHIVVNCKAAFSDSALLQLCVTSGADELIFSNFKNSKIESLKACRALSDERILRCEKEVRRTTKDYRR